MGGILYALVFLLTVVAVIGHGIWVLVAKVIQALSGTPPGTVRERPGPSHCPACDTPLQLKSDHYAANDYATHTQPAYGPRYVCPTCGWPQAHHVQRPANVGLRRLQALIARYQEMKLIEPLAAQRISAALAAEIGQAQAESAQRAADVATAAGALQSVQPITPASDFASITADLRDTRAPSNVQVELLARDGAPQAASAPAETVHAAETAAGEAAEPQTESAAERVRRLLERQQSAPAHVPSSAVPSAGDSPAERVRAPRRSLGDLLAAFMEEKNIRWGELIGGLLIVCCSIALVISFWAKIAERPFLKFFVFNGVSAGLFGIGFYTGSRWKLRNTSEGLLIIASLLVPLNFLAIAAFSQVVVVSDVLMIGGELLSIALFSVLLYFAGRSLLCTGTALLAVVVMVPSVMQLLVRRFVTPDSEPALLLGLAALPALTPAAACGGLLWLLGRRAGERKDEAPAVYSLLGIALFSALLPLGLLLIKTEQPGPTLHHLATAVSGLAIAPLACGLHLWRRMAGAELVLPRIAGSSIAVLGAGLLVAGVVLAWPNPLQLMATALIVFCVLSTVAWQGRISAAHVPALLCVAIAYLVCYWVARGELAWNLNDAERAAALLLSGPSGTALTPLVALIGLAAFGWTRFGRRDDALSYGAAAAIVAVASVGLVSWFGFAVPGDPSGAAWVYAIYAAVALITAVPLRRPLLLWVGTGLMLAALAQAIVYNLAERTPWPLPWLATWQTAGTLLVGGFVALRWLGDESRKRVFTSTLTVLVTLTLGASLILIVRAIVLQAATSDAIAVYLAWFSALSLALAMASENRAVFTIFQATLAGALFFGIAAQLARQSWFAALDHAWWEAWCWQAEAIALALLSLGWQILKIVLGLSGVQRSDDVASGWRGARRMVFISTLAGI